ncbi:Choline transporter-like protein [Ophiocordyceps camponoti-floridani]|uniref:Protein PNS1 n=1 Tax=Ophiocordyceps camponoti-floridani TaxID=2030778 RepID=A0A8H4QEC2_9HYPO|nr:Choline transporter-like protein [Ophiocordyceps camponoti-floridani]
MFSEYASRFLAQSQSRLSNLGQPEGDHPSRPAGDWPSSRPSRRERASQPTRTILSRGNPYQQNGTGSRFGHLGFASRISAAQDAPLFHSTLDEFREEDDEEEEREREAADLFALQRSRRVAAASKLAESAESAVSHGSEGATAADNRPHEYSGIKSSWNGARSRHGNRRPSYGALMEDGEDDEDDGGKGKMVDIGLESQEDGDGGDPPESLLGGEVSGDDHDQPPSTPPFRSLQPAVSEREPFISKRSSIDSEEPGSVGPRESEAGNATPTVEGELFRHDPFFAWIFLISLGGMMSTFILVWLHTSPRKSPVGDTIYTTLQKSFDMLAIDTVVSIMVSLVWLAALRSFVRPLVSVILVAVPVIMLSFSLYSFVSSFQGRTGGASAQDTVMRWASLIPAGACVLWLWLVVKGRRAIQQAIEMLQFSSKILAQNPGLLAVGFGSLALIVLWTWAWLAMFTRVFMGGYFSQSLVRFVIRLSSWWLGAAFILMYLWTLAVINAIHRATTAATVSQWYFHRNAGPTTASRDIVTAALSHATTTMFGSICQSTLLALLLRAPLLFLPRRAGTALANLAAFWVPTPMMALTNPLTVTYSAIHSQGLVTSARGLDRMDVVSPTLATTTLTPRALRARGGTASGLLPYRLAKLLLVATRFAMATGLGFAGWIMTAKQLQIQLPDGMGVRGSAYAYVVGIMASFIGYSVMGAMEGILSGIVDAVLICYGSERRMERGQGRFCLEAAYLFGEGRAGEGGYV